MFNEKLIEFDKFIQQINISHIRHPDTKVTRIKNKAEIKL